MWNNDVMTPLHKKLYKVTKRIQQGTTPLSSVVFNFIDARFSSHFASAGGNVISLYNCREVGDMSLLQSYTDEDREESFYTVSWACGLKGNPFVVAGGLKGIIRVINATDKMVHKTLVGHEGSVNEIKTHHLKPHLVLSASNDGYVRLWNVEDGICVLIFPGSGGPRSPVLSVDFHPYDMTRFISCCMDTTVKIWSMEDFWQHVEMSFLWLGDPSEFQIKFVELPVFTARGHPTLVTCNRWYGGYFLSKSMKSEMLLWQPQLKENSHGEGALNVQLTNPIPKSSYFSIKFSFDPSMNYVSIGNQKGEIYVWDLYRFPPVLVAVLSHYKSKSLIRQTAMSANGSTIIAASEDGTLWRWDKKPSY